MIRSARPSVAVVGAGLAGCVTARLLAEQGINVTCFDGGRGAGGRMSSRSLDGFSFDHGAVCFSDKVFKDVVQLLDGSNALAKWDARFGTLSANKEGIWTFDKDEGDSNHYVGVPTMNEVCKYLLDSPLVSTCFSTPVSSGQLQDGTWALSDRKGAELGSYQVLVSTDKLMADEQSPNFFKGVGADLSAFHSLAHSCEMKAQFVLMLGFKNSLGLPFDAAFAATKLPALKSLSNESSKPGRATSGESWTVQSSTTFAADVLREHPMRGADPRESKRLAQEMASAALLADFRTIASSLGSEVPAPEVNLAHRWGSAEGVLTAEVMAQLGLEQEQQCFVDREAHFIACGDYFVAPKVSGAALSGQSAAHHALEML